MLSNQPQVTQAGSNRSEPGFSDSKAYALNHTPDTTFSAPSFRGCFLSTYSALGPGKQINTTQMWSSPPSWSLH